MTKVVPVDFVYRAHDKTAQERRLAKIQAKRTKAPWQHHLVDGVLFVFDNKTGLDISSQLPEILTAISKDFQLPQFIGFRNWDSCYYRVIPLYEGEILASVQFELLKSTELKHVVLEIKREGKLR